MSLPAPFFVHLRAFLWLLFLCLYTRGWAVGYSNAAAGSSRILEIGSDAYGELSDHFVVSPLSKLSVKIWTRPIEGTYA